MTAYTSSVRVGPPLSGSYRVGDTFVDATSARFECFKSGRPGEWGFQGPATTQQTTSVDIGAKNGSTVAATFEYGAGGFHQTVLTLTATPVTVTDDAGVAQYGGTGKIYDFPEGHICVLGAVVSGALTLGTTGTIIDTYTGVCSLGSVTATTGATLVSGEADILKSFAITQAVAKVAAVKGGPVATQVTEAGALWFDGHTSALDMFLNFAIADDATHTSGTGAFTGTVKFAWLLLGDN